jgi:hypothetical protein
MDTVMKQTKEVMEMGWSPAKGKKQCREVEGPDGKIDPNKVVCFIEVNGHTVERTIRKDEATGKVYVGAISTDFVGKQSEEAAQELKKFVKEYLQEKGWISH